jgi:hypothetical protein
MAIGADFHAVCPTATCRHTEGRGNANEQASTVFRLSGMKNGNDVLWRSSEGDCWVNYWLLPADFPADSKVRLGVNDQSTLTVTDVCLLIRPLG